MICYIKLYQFLYDLFLQQMLCDDLEQTQPQLGQLLTNGRLLLDKVPDEDRAFLESQLNALEELQASVIRKSLAKQEELIRHIVQQQDFQTQVQSCMHVLQEVETSLGEWELGVASGLSEMKEKLSLCEVGVINVLFYNDELFRKQKLSHCMLILASYKISFK